MAATLLWLRSNMRSNWRAAALVVLITALCSGAAMATVAGARRTTTAFTRFVRESRQPQIFLAGPDQASADTAAAVMRRFADADHVGRAVFLAAIPAGVATNLQLDIATLGVLDGAIGTTFAITKVVAGRRADGDDEIAINEKLAATLGLHVGERIAMVGYSASALQGCDSGSPECAADVQLGKVTVVGVLRSTDDISPETYGAMSIETSPALTAKWLPLVATQQWLTEAWVVSSVDRALIAESIRKSVGPERFDGPTAHIFLEANAKGNPERTTGALDIERNALLIVGLLALLSGLLAVPMALARFQASTATDWLRLRALGATRHDRGIMAVISSLGIGSVGALVAVGGAIAASPLLPIGLARRAEPSPGVHADWTVLTLGAAATVIAVTVGGFAAIMFVRAQPVTVGTGRVTRMLTLSRPVPGMARRLLTEHGRISRIARTAGASAILGVAIVAGTLMVIESLNNLAGNPALFGAPWDFQGSLTTKDPATIDKIATDPRVASAAILHGGGIVVDGHGMGVVGVEPLRGALEPTVLEGRMVRGDGEILLSPSMMGTLNLRLGDSVHVANAGVTGSLTVVGSAVPIEMGLYSSDDGAVISADDFTRFGVPPRIESQVGNEIAVRAATVADLIGVSAEVAAATGGFDRSIATSFRPARIANLQRVGGALWMTLAFAALLTALVLLNGISSLARRGGHDLAVGRALGMRRGQIRQVVVLHGVMLTAATIVVGLPLGIVTGRLVWRAVSTSVSSLYAPQLSPSVLVASSAAAVAVAVVTGLFVGRRSIRGSVATWLGSE